jgi:eukaryotic-like serine/threonine-protein kinase
MAKKKDNFIGRYKILDELGRGAMGIVYRAEDPSLDRIVALKTISLGDADEDRKAYEKRFLLEAKAAGKLTHPNIVTIFDYGEEEDTAYMAMELLEGQDLRARIRQGDIPPMEAVEIALQVADGLGFAHEFGVVHRDIKPGNIMLLERGAVKIMDFGIARMRHVDSTRTSTGMVLGTPRYMSPEQITGQPVDQRSDVFSLGTVLYEMLTQTSLFAGQDVNQIAHNVANAEPAPPSRTNPELPQMLDFIVARALKKDASVRYQDAYEMAADLRDVLAEMRGKAPKRGERDDSEKTQTLKMAAGADKLPVAPAANAIARETRLPICRVFSSEAALERVEVRAKGERFTVPPKRVGLLRRLLQDRRPRRLLVVALVAAALGAWIGVG